MKLTDLNWHTYTEGESWVLSANVCDDARPYLWTRRKLFDVIYRGRTQVAFGGGREIWHAIDRRYWLDDVDGVHVFDHVHEAKAWVDSIVRLT